MLSPHLFIYPGVVFSSSPSFQTHLHSSCTFSPFIIHQRIRCRHHSCCLSCFPDSLPLVTFQYGWINLRSPRRSFTPLPSIMLLSCRLSLILLTPALICLHTPCSASPHFSPHPQAQRSFSSCFTSEPPSVPRRCSTPESPPLHLTVH